MSRKPSPTYRISRAALGKRLVAMIELELQGELAPDEFHDTIHAAYRLILDPTYEPPEQLNVNREVYEAQRTEIEKSARRSAAARELALRRREQRESMRDSRHRQQSCPAPADVSQEQYNFVEDEEIRRQVRALVRKQLATPLYIPPPYYGERTSYHPRTSVWDIK